MKAQKNDVEVIGMKNAHLRDAVALCDFMSLLQDEVGRNVINTFINQLVDGNGNHRKLLSITKTRSYLNHIIIINGSK